MNKLFVTNYLLGHKSSNTAKRPVHGWLVKPGPSFPTQKAVFGCGVVCFMGFMPIIPSSDWEGKNPQHTAAALVGFWLMVMTLCHALAKGIVVRGRASPQGTVPHPINQPLAWASPCESSRVDHKLLVPEQFMFALEREEGEALEEPPWLVGDHLSARCSC